MRTRILMAAATVGLVVGLAVCLRPLPRTWADPAQPNGGVDPPAQLPPPPGDVPKASAAPLPESLPPSNPPEPIGAAELPGVTEPLPPQQPTLDPVSAPAPAAAPEDPMQVVEAFVTSSRKQADASIQALTQERDALRTRLQKVEEALGRWQAVARALDQTQPAPPPPQFPATPDAGEAKARVPSNVLPPPPIDPPPKP